MDGIEIIVATIIGLLIGSTIWVFANNQANRRPLLRPPGCTADTMAVRVGKGAAAIETAPERCNGVLSTLAWLPLYGFGLARTCPACGRSQPIWRVAVELAVAGYFALIAYRFGTGFDMIEAMVLAIPLLIILLVDAWTRLIFTNIILLGVLLGFGFAAGHSWRTVVNGALSGGGAVLVFAGLMVLAALIYRNMRVVPFGLGDVYLAGMIGVMTRYPDVLTALFAGIIIAGVVLFTLLITRRVGRRTAVPYGPFLCLGALLVLAFPS